MPTNLHLSVLLAPRYLVFKVLLPFIARMAIFVSVHIARKVHIALHAEPYNAPRLVIRMLEYREFPVRTALTYILFSPSVAFVMLVIVKVIEGSLLPLTLLEHHGLLGFGALAATFSLLVTGYIVDRLQRKDILMFLSALIPSIVGLLGSMLGFPNDYSPQIETALVISSFACLAFLMVSWTVQLNRTVVVKFRGKVNAAFLALALVAFLIYYLLSAIGIVLMGNTLLLPAVISFVAVITAAILRPWKLDQAPLAVQGSVMKYFGPMALVLAAHMLWFFVVKLRFQAEGYGTLSQTVGFGIFEVCILIVGVVGAGLLADFLGRKRAFSTLILLMGLLTIFGSAMYESFFVEPSLPLDIGLLVFERFIEGYMLGLCLLLIWSELGSAKTKGLRLSFVWFFFLGYMALFWALDLEATVFGFTFLVPEELTLIGGNVAVFLALIALYMIGPLPQIIGREIEMKELAFDFDDKQVRRTVDAFVGTDEFASIRSQLDVLDAGAELSEISDKDMSDILGDDFVKKLPLRQVPGIGPNLEKKLRRGGYKSAAQLSGETPKRLAEKIDGLGLARARKIINDARNTVKKTVKPTRKKNNS